MCMIPYRFELLPMGSLHFTGMFDRAIRFVQERQLKDPAVWKRLAEPFRSGNADDANLAWRGEYWGKLMRGASLTYYYTQDPDLYEILEDSVRDLLSVQDGEGRFSTYSISREFQGWDIWCRKYVMLGMQYFLDICREEALRGEILEALKRHADYIVARIGPPSAGKRSITQTSKAWGGMNSSSILEPFVRLYTLTGAQRYLDFARYIIENGGVEGFDLFRAAVEDRLFPYEYPVTKAYEMMSCFEGLLWYYRVAKEPRYLRAAERFADRVLRSDITVIGSAGCTHELFDHSAIRQFDPAFDGIMQETCVTVTWMKLCYLLLQITGNVKYADAIERSACNALLGAVNTELQTCKGMIPVFDSYSPLRKGRRGREMGGYQKLDDTFAYGCCLAIGAAGTACTALSSVSRTERGFAFHLYQPGLVRTATASGQEASFRIDTDYPAGEEIVLTLQMQAPEQFEILFRLPPFGAGSTLQINGETLAENRAGFYAADRIWQGGDTIRIRADLTIRLWKDSDFLPEAANRPNRYGVLMRGPVVLALDTRANPGAVDIPLNLKQGAEQAEPIPDFALFPAEQAYRLCCGDRNVVFVDYASSGKEWNDRCETAAWVRITE